MQDMGYYFFREKLRILDYGYRYNCCIFFRDMGGLNSAMT
jgi:hypothetical protein